MCLLKTLSLLRLPPREECHPRKPFWHGGPIKSVRVKPFTVSCLSGLVPSSHSLSLRKRNSSPSLELQAVRFAIIGCAVTIWRLSMAWRAGRTCSSSHCCYVPFSSVMRSPCAYLSFSLLYHPSMLSRPSMGRKKRTRNKRRTMMS